MTGMEIPGVGMAPGGKIVKPEDEVFYYIFTTNTRIFNFCLPLQHADCPLHHADCCRGDVGKHALEIPRPILHPEADVCRPPQHRHYLV